MSKPIISENQILLLKKYKNASKTNNKIKFLIKSKEIKTEKIITVLKNIFYNLKKKEKRGWGTHPSSSFPEYLGSGESSVLLSRNEDKELIQVPHLSENQECLPSSDSSQSFDKVLLYLSQDITKLINIYNFIGIKNINSGINSVFLRLKGRINSRKTAARTKYYEIRVISKFKQEQYPGYLASGGSSVLNKPSPILYNINSINLKDESFTELNLKNGLIGIKFSYYNILFITYSLTKY